MLTERSILSQCEVLPNGIIQVRMSDQIVDGEVVKASTFRRYVLAPGSDLTSQPQQVVAIATAIWNLDSCRCRSVHHQPRIECYS